jgi:uncharacterized protein
MGHKGALDLLREKRAGNWFDGGVRFRCIHPACSDCCSGLRGPGYVWINADEMEAIAKHIGVSFNAFTRRYVRQVENSFSLIEKPNYDCIFLKDGKCEVYPVRPTQCRTYPFWPETMTSRKRWEREAQNCPGVEVDDTTVSGIEIELALEKDAANRAKCGR